MSCVGIAMLVVAGSVRADDGITSFESKIRPELVEHCYACHSAKAATEKKLKGGLLLDTRAGWMAGGASGPAILPGEPERSALVHAIRWKDELSAMPPKKKLPDQAIADLEAWVKMGAPDPREGGLTVRRGIDWDAAKTYWAFQPVKVTKVTVKNKAWPRSSIDTYILAKLEAAGIAPASAATTGSPMSTARSLTTSSPD